MVWSEGNMSLKNPVTILLFNTGQAYHVSGGGDATPSLWNVQKYLARSTIASL